MNWELLSIGFIFKFTMKPVVKCQGLGKKGKCGNKKRTDPPYYCAKHLDQRPNYDSDTSMQSSHNEMPISCATVEAPPLVIETVAALADLMKTDLSLKPTDKKTQILSLIQELETGLKKLRIAIAEI